jgi:pimeloyl-ACP methyl ester carboxylesterase
MADAIYTFVDGSYIGDFDPAIAEALAGLDLSQPGPTLWPQFDMLAAKPLMTIRGEYSALLTQETLSDMAHKAPAMQICLAEGQGHAPLLHHPSVYPAIQGFLNAQDQD